MNDRVFVSRYSVACFIYGDSDVDSFGSVALLNRVGEVQETTDAVLYLATAGFTTGHILNVDGGYSAARA